MDTGKSIEAADKGVNMEWMVLNDERYLKITNHDGMRPFFMSIVSDSNHWLFISSNGGLTAGRKNKEYALFPYYTDDKITESAEITGSKTIFQVHEGDETHIWEPFSVRYADRYETTRNLYKSIYGNKIIFEEINHNLGLSFRYQWNSSGLFGFVRQATLANTTGHDKTVTILDGLQNILPYGIQSDLQTASSNLADAYKRSELHPASGMGIYALSAIIVDRAEPSEALKANIAWSLGLEDPVCLLSSKQLQAFREKQAIHTEYDIKGEKGAYFISATVTLPGQTVKQWKIMADVNRNHAQITSLIHDIKDIRGIEKQIQEDINKGTEALIRLVAEADGLQNTADLLKDTRHFSNTLFNIMRGGIFDNHYTIKKQDFISYLQKANREVASRNQPFLNELGDLFTLSDLKKQLTGHHDADLIRLCLEYLPLKFSRRHGDPSRPWNNFSINTINEKDGSQVLDYEGNWRDIFQNWEALGQSYPGFIEGMICKFVNASTFDGYNPYRITKGGIDWETIEPHNPWSYIGYWGDHQIIYLLKLMELSEKFHPNTLQSYFDKEWFTYAAVPYLIKPYDQILKNHKDTILFDKVWDKDIRNRREQLGADGALLTVSHNQIYHVNLIEKILASVLAKLSNFVPEGGIWMNTQRPEWNDANNALVGNGVSMVTLYYLHRFMKFFQEMLSSAETASVMLSTELIAFFDKVNEALHQHHQSLSGSIDDSLRKTILDQLGEAASAYRQQIYQNGFRGTKEPVFLADLQKFTEVCIEFMQHTIRANQRADKLYHAYNLLTIHDNGVSISHLDEMLEGQVAILSAGCLPAEEALEVVDALKNSALFREDQYSYILYPEKQLPGFLKKNIIPNADAQSSELIKALISKGNKEVVEQDVEGHIHFNGNFRNAGDLATALDALAQSGYEELVKRGKTLLLGIFEKVFNHKAFTGRSGTFYAYEGLGSIYWHMVSKLHLAVQECSMKAMAEKADPAVIGRLLDHYYEIDAGIGVHKSPELYGAFPTDPYSHTPKHRGAQQPGMTGQVKEDILVRFAELGVTVINGHLQFNPQLLRKEELLQEEKAFTYQTLDGETKQLVLKPGQLGFTYCMVPVVYTLADQNSITIHYADGKNEVVQGNALSPSISNLIFNRTGEIVRLEVCVRVP